jgi:hypothetical protein
VSRLDDHIRPGKSTSHVVNDTRLHVLIPANNPDVNLCKTLLTSNALGYPDPIILAWQEKYNAGESVRVSLELQAIVVTDAITDYLLGGGSHLAKISAVLDWLEKSNDAADNDLVVMMDAYGSLPSCEDSCWPHDLLDLQTSGSN